MLYGMANDGCRIPANKGATALCPHCHAPLIPKCGRIKEHHWAHKESNDCPYATGMTFWHYAWLREFENHFEPGWDVEHFFDSIRFDAFHPQKRQAVEFQRTLDLEYVKTKVSICAKEGIKLFWLMNPRLFEHFVYTRDFLRKKGHVLFALRACRRKIVPVLDTFLGQENISFLIDFTKDTCLPRYVSAHVDTLRSFSYEEPVSDQRREPRMPLGIYVIKEPPILMIYTDTTE